MIFEGGYGSGMDWFRRNWPDVAIGAALVAVIAAIVATLLTGGSLFPLTRPTQATAPAVTAPAATAPSAATPSATTPAPTGVLALPPGGGATTSAASPAATISPTPTAAGTATPSVTAVDPPRPAATSAPTPSVAATTAPSAVVTPTATQSTPPAAATTSAPSTATSTAAAATASVTRPAPVAGTLPAPSADPAAPYRVSVGAYGSAENAQRQAAAFRDAGYPVFVGAQGTLTIVLVGPYDTEAAAEQVAARIRTGGFGIEPVIYRFRPDAPSAAASTPAPAAAPATSAAPTAVTVPAPVATAPVATAPVATATVATASSAPAAATPAAAPAAVATSGRFLQAGAFSSAATAQPRRDQLARLGYAASERSEGGFVKLLVGPFDDAGLRRAQAQLAAAGIDSFVR